MKIVYCIPATSNSGGMERVLSGKANYLASLGHEIAIITTDQRGKAPFFPFREGIAQYDLGINYDENNDEGILSKATFLSREEASPQGSAYLAPARAKGGCRRLYVWG